jgi:hypothetical protein
MTIWRGEREVLAEISAHVPHCPPQTPYGVPWNQTRASATRSLPLTASATKRPILLLDSRIYELVSTLSCFRTLCQSLCGDLNFDLTTWTSAVLTYSWRRCQTRDGDVSLVTNRILIMTSLFVIHEKALNNFSITLELGMRFEIEIKLDGKRNGKA